MVGEQEDQSSPTSFTRPTVTSYNSSVRRYPPNPPELLTTCHFLEAIWARSLFPELSVVLPFGPPVLLDLASDIRDPGRGHVVEAYWAGSRGLMRCASEGRCLLAAESLFRSEQFFYQTGVEVPWGVTSVQLD